MRPTPPDAPVMRTRLASNGTVERSERRAVSPTIGKAAA